MQTVECWSNVHVGEYYVRDFPTVFLSLLDYVTTNEELGKGPGEETSTSFKVSKIFGGTCKGSLFPFEEEDTKVCPLHRTTMGFLFGRLKVQDW